MSASPIVSGPVRRAVLIVNPMGLHMRPATTFAMVAGKLAGDVAVWNGDRRANGKSLWDLIGLCAVPGTQLIVEVDGLDAIETLERLAEILQSPGDPE